MTDHAMLFRWLAVAAGVVLASCDAPQRGPDTAVPSLWIVTTISSDDSAPSVRRECRRPVDMFLDGPLHPVFSLVPHPNPCSTSQTKLTSGGTRSRSSCALSEGATSTTLSEVSADGRTMHVRIEWRRQSAKPAWTESTFKQLGACPVQMPPDQFTIWMGPDGKWTDFGQEQQKLVRNARRGQAESR